MPLPYSTSFSFTTATDYKASLPAYVPRTDASVTKNYIGKSYNNKSKTIKLSSTDYGYLTFDVLYSGSARIATISFESNIGEIAVGTDIDDLFVPFSDGKPISGYDIKLTSGTTKRIYVIVNGDQTNKTNLLKIHTSVGVTNIPSGLTSTMTVDYDCFTPLYQYTMGLHAYSAWDSINSPKLTTKLYSKTPITSWTTDTKIWARPGFDHPAFPYYYGYSPNGKVYKIGGELDRSYGIKKRKTVYQTLWRSIWGKPAIITDYVYGPKKWPSLSVSDGTDACVNVFMSGVGLVKEVITASTLIQPQKYKYYMGYHASNRQSSNDNHFQKYVQPQEKFYAVTGETHAGVKLTDGFVDAFETNTDLGAQTTIAIAAGIPIIAGAFAGKILALFAATALACPGGFSLAAAAALAGVLGPIAIILGIIMLVYSLFVFNDSHDYNEDACPSFLHHYTTTPYIENGSVLSRNVLLTTNNNGYYSDGVYFYQQSGGVISSKTLSYSTNALLFENPLKLSFQYSLQADSPTLVKGINNLLVLPYTSGKPIPYCGEGNPIYYSEALSETITLNECAELTTNPGTITLNLEASSSVSCISGVDANNKALITWTKTKSNALNKYNYSSTLTGTSLGTLESAFTHELKLETNPNYVHAFYSNVNGLGLTIGKKLFYDIEGRYEVANGFYAINGTSPYRTFYQTVSGAVSNIYTMASSGSTTVTDSNSTVFPLVTTDLDHTSDWYISEMEYEIVYSLVRLYSSPRCYDINTAIANSYIKRGYVTSDLKTSLKIFPSNTSISTPAEGVTGWYQPISKWGLIDPFYYNNSQTIAINAEEICLVSYPTNNQLYGFYVYGTSGSYQVPLYNEVRLTADVYRNVSGTETFVASYPVTASATDVKTYVPYGNLVSASYDITAIKISSIDSTNPINKITYVTGSFTNCINPSPSVTPTPSITATPTVTPSVSITPSRTPSITPSVSITPSLTPSITPTKTATPSVTPTPSITITPSITPSITATPSITGTPSRTPSVTPTPSITPSITPTVTPSPSTMMYKYYFELQSANGSMTLNSTGGNATFTTNYSLILAGQNTYNVNGSTITANSGYYISKIERYVPFNVNPTTTINLTNTTSYTFSTFSMSSAGVNANEFETIKVYFTIIPSPTPTPSITPSPSTLVVDFGTGFANSTYGVGISGLIKYNGKYFVNGGFGTYRGQTPAYATSINQDGTINASWAGKTVSNSRNAIDGVQIDSNGDFYLTGGSYANWNGFSYNQIAKINSSGVAYTSWVPSLQSTFNQASKTLQLINNVLYVGGDNAIGACNVDGTIYSPLKTKIVMDGNGRLLQANGKLFWGGNLTAYFWDDPVGTTNYFPTKGLVYINSDGTPNTAFNFTTVSNNAAVNAIVYDSSINKYYIAGDITTINGVGADRVMRLNSDFTLDSTFVIGANAGGYAATALTLRSDGKILAGFANGTIILYNSDGSVNSTSYTFGTGANAQVNGFYVEYDSSLIIYGQFTSFNGTTANNIVRVVPTGAPAVSPSVTPSVTPSRIPGGSPSVTPSTSPPTVPPSVTPSVTPSLPPFSPSATPSRTPDPSRTPSVTPSRTPDPSITPTPSMSPDLVPASPSRTPSVTPSITPSATPSITPSHIPTVYGYASIYFDGTGSTPICDSSAATVKGLYWIDNATLTLGAQVWNDSARTISATAGWYGQKGAGSTYYYVQGGFVNDIGTCPIPPSVTPTPSVTSSPIPPSRTPSVTPSPSPIFYADVQWNTVGSAGGTGRLEIRRTSDGLVVFSNTSNSGTQSGITSLVVGTQYTVYGFFGSGSGNIVRLRVCDTVTGQLGYSGDITAAVDNWSINITPSSTTNTYYMNLTSGTGNTPAVCPF